LLRCIWLNGRLATAEAREFLTSNATSYRFGYFEKKSVGIFWCGGQDFLQKIGEVLRKRGGFVVPRQLYD
jgi:hypothetical protein